MILLTTSSSFYMDDLLIFSKDEQSHLRHIEFVFSRLKDRELFVSPKKCEFLKEEIEFLGLVEESECVENLAKT